MKNFCLSIALAILGISATVSAEEAAAPKMPYQLAVWADVSFDDKSQVTQITFPEKDQLPKSFIAYLTNALATSSFVKPEEIDTIKSLETGVRVIVEIDPATSKAKILSQDLMPRPVKLENLSEPLYRLKGEWSGRLLVTCAISAAGRCAKPRIDKSTNAPGEIPKVLLGTLGAWRFIPQKQAGNAIDGEFTTWVNIEGDNSAPPDTFDKRIK